MFGQHFAIPAIVSVNIMALSLMEFQNQGLKLERFLQKNEHTQKKLLNFENWTNGEPQNLQKSKFLKLILLIFHEKKLKN